MYGVPVSLRNLLEVLRCEVDVYSSSLVMQLAMNTAQFKFSAIQDKRRHINKPLEVAEVVPSRSIYKVFS